MRTMWLLSKINRHLRIVLALSCLIPLLFVGCQKDLSGNIAPKAINGVLDLSNWDLDRDGPVDLSGEWEFYWNQLINPNEFSTPNPPQKASIMSVPGKSIEASAPGFAREILKFHLRKVALKLLSKCPTSIIASAGPGKLFGWAD